MIVKYWYVIRSIDNHYGYPGAIAFKNKEDAYKYCTQMAKDKLLENNLSVKYFLSQTKEGNDFVIRAKCPNCNYTWTITNEYESIKTTVYLPEKILVENEKNTDASSFEISIKLAHNKD